MSRVFKGYKIELSAAVLTVGLRSLLCWDSAYPERFLQSFKDKINVEPILFGVYDPVLDFVLYNGFRMALAALYLGMATCCFNTKQRLSWDVLKWQYLRMGLSLPPVIFLSLMLHLCWPWLTVANQSQPYPVRCESGDNLFNLLASTIVGVQGAVAIVSATQVFLFFVISRLWGCCIRDKVAAARESVKQPLLSFS